MVGEVYKLGTGVQAVEVNYKNAIDFRWYDQSQRFARLCGFLIHNALAEQRKGELRTLAVSTAATGSRPIRTSRP